MSLSYHWLDAGATFHSFVLRAKVSMSCINHCHCIIHVWINRWTFQRTMAVMFNEQNVSISLHYYHQHHFIPSSYHLPSQRSYFIYVYVLICTPCTHNIGTCKHGSFTRYRVFSTIVSFFLGFSSENRRVIWQLMPCTRDRKPEFEPAIDIFLFRKYTWIGCAMSRLRDDKIFWRIIVYIPFHLISHRKLFNCISSILRCKNELSKCNKSILGSIVWWEQHPQRS